MMLNTKLLIKRLMLERETNPEGALAVIDAIENGKYTSHFLNQNPYYRRVINKIKEEITQ